MTNSKWFCLWPGLWRALTRSGEYQCERWTGYPGGEDDQTEQTMWRLWFPATHRLDEPDEAHDYLRDAKASVARREAHLPPPRVRSSIETQ